jgi:hypothetical protein
MALTLTELGHDVIGVDGDESRVQQLADVITHALQIDATTRRRFGLPASTRLRWPSCPSAKTSNQVC